MKEICPDVSGQDDSPHRLHIVRSIMQQIIGENPYAPDMEWELWDKARVLEDINGLPNGVTAYDVHQEYLRVFEGE